MSEARVFEGTDLSGRVAVVTGSNTGIGKVTARELARAGARVVMACRNQDKAAAARDDIVAAVPDAEVSLAMLDLGSVTGVREAAEALKAGPKIDLLINNAGMAGSRGATDDGFEIHFGVNHMGPFALTLALEDHLVDGGRVVNLASRAHTRVKGIDFEAVRQPTRTRAGFHEYAVSKLCNVLFSWKLAERLAPRDIGVFSLHPGVVASDIWRRLPGFVLPLAKLFMITNEEGAMTSLHCATAPDLPTGKYWDEQAVREPAAPARDAALRDELWAKSEAWLAEAGA